MFSLFLTDLRYLCQYSYAPAVLGYKPVVGGAVKAGHMTVTG